MPEHVTLINAFEVPADEAPQFIAAWEKTRDYLHSAPGYIDTSLHQAVPRSRSQFVNIAHWSSPEDFAAATQSPGFPLRRSRTQRLRSASRPLPLPAHALSICRPRRILGHRVLRSAPNTTWPALERRRSLPPRGAFASLE